MGRSFAFSRTLVSPLLRAFGPYRKCVSLNILFKQVQKPFDSFETNESDKAIAVQARY